MERLPQRPREAHGKRSSRVSPVLAATKPGCAVKITLPPDDHQPG